MLFSPTLAYTSSPSYPLGRPHTHTPYTHHQELHNWFTTILSSTILTTITEDYLLDYLPTPMIINHDSIPTIVDQAKYAHTQDLFQFLTYTKYRATSTHTPTTPTLIPTTSSLQIKYIYSACYII